MSPLSTYRSALQVSPERIARLREIELNELMRQLLRVQANRCGCRDTSVNAEVAAADDGCDGWTGQTEKADRWLGDTATCWQFKTGTYGEPRRLSGEVDKDVPRSTLQQGGRFVVVASGSTAGKPGTDRRHRVLADAAWQAGLPAERIEVYGSEKLAEWCNQYPAIAARLAGRPEGLWTWDDWNRNNEHEPPFQTSPKIDSDLTEKRLQLDFDTESEAEALLHLHVQGAPGVGKTRFSLELCRAAPWRDTVIYIGQAEDVRLTELIDSVATEPDVRLTIVADEAQPERLEPLRDSVGRADGRVRLVTVGSCRTPDPRRIPPVTVEPLEADAMRKAVRGWHPVMPQEHIEFVTRFADGYMKLARLTANAVAADTEATIPDLLDRQEIRIFLDRLLQGSDRRALYVVAVMAQVGWTDDKQQEGQAVAEHLGLNWNDVQYQVAQVDRRLEVARRGGRYRYISPEPLGLYLAYEAWQTYPALLRSLPEKLPSESAKEAYYRRLESLASLPAARAYLREQVRFFFRIDDFVKLHAARRWSAFSSADPELAADLLRQALSNATLDDRRKIQFRTLCEIVWRLTDIASRSAGFHDAVTALALLAEAGNDVWGRDVHRDFGARFQVYSGGTALPYLRRLITLDELVEQGRPKLTSLVVRALARVDGDSSWAFVQSASDEVPEPNWRPSSRREYLECISAAVSRLRTIAAAREPGLLPDLLAAAEPMSRLLRFQDTRPIVRPFFIALRDSYPEAREPLRQKVAAAIRRYQESFSPDHGRFLNELHAEFEDSSLEGRLRQHVGSQRWEEAPIPEITTLGEELTAKPNLLEKYLPWLTSGEASQAWYLGGALAAADSDGRLTDILTRQANSGPDLRVVCGYVAARRKALGDEWYERWIAAQYEHAPFLLVEAARLCGTTDRVATYVAELLHGRSLNTALIGRLAYADWRPTSDSTLHAVLSSMVETGHRSTALGILRTRLQWGATDVGRWRSLALVLATDQNLIRCLDIPYDHWQRLAKMLAPDHPQEIAAAIIHAHAQRAESKHNRSGTWFLEHRDEAVEVLRTCIARAPYDVWSTLRTYLWPFNDARSFIIGFPSEIVERLPVDDVLCWIDEPSAEQSVRRAVLIARMTSKNALTDDRSLAARIIAKHGGSPIVDEEFLNQRLSGTDYGPLSSRLEYLVKELDDISRNTSHRRMRTWANKSASSLNEMIENQRQYEEERALLMR